MICLPVIEHVIEVLGSINLIPCQSLVARLAHLLQKFVELLYLVSVHVHGVNEDSLLKEFEAGHALIGH